jgi:hypothetical protein
VCVHQRKGCGAAKAVSERKGIQATKRARLICASAGFFACGASTRYSGSPCVVAGLPGQVYRQSLILLFWPRGLVHEERWVL